MNTDTTSYYFTDSLINRSEYKEAFLQDQLYSIDPYPFGSILSDSVVYNQKVEVTPVKQKEVFGHEGIKRPFTLESDDTIFALLLVCFVFFSSIYKVGISFFRDNLRILSSSHPESSLYSETTSREFWFNFFLVFQTILLTSVIFFDYVLERDWFPLPRSSFFTIILFILTLYLFLGAKYLIYKIFGFLFNIKPSIDIWLRTYVIILEMLGIIGFIPTMMLVYSQYFHEYILWFLFMLFIVSRILLFYRLITFFLREHVNILFLITYLCSVEIIPYVMLFQVLNYLYKVDTINLLWL